MANPFATPAMAAGYARSRPPVHPRVVDRIRRQLGISEPVDTALDVGCGSGVSTAALEPLAKRRVGVEPAVEMLRWAGAVAPGALFVGGRAEQLPVGPGSVDLMTAAGSLNYADLGAFFPEAVRTLRPGGVLAVYDFSAGRAFPDSGALDSWFAEFERRYPQPRNSGHLLNPEALAAFQSGMRLIAHDDFEIALALGPAFYLDYVLTETNVAEAVENGTSLEDIRGWCAASLEPVFQGSARDVLFRGYIAYMTPC